MSLKLFVILGAVVLAALGTYIVNLVVHVPDRPRIDDQRWWGLTPRPNTEDTSIRAFKVDFNDSMIQDLKNRIKNRRPLTKPLEGIQSEYGMNTDYLTGVLDYWIEKYDFKNRAKLLNEYPHYKTRIQGLDIHFIRMKPNNPKGLQVLPLLMLHGWPSSSKEFVKMIPTLTTPRKGYDFVYEVIAADLPGFGFSEGTNKQGMNTVEIGIIMRNLMHRLGYTKFYVHAGDWGAQCATHMVTLFPDEILGFHSTMLISSRLASSVKILLGSLYPPVLGDGEYLHRLYPLSDYFRYVIRESGYFHIMATKPDTIGVSLTDSPSGLASFVMEKMAVTTNSDELATPHGGLKDLDIDDVLDTLTILWTNNCIVTSSRIYAEATAMRGEELGKWNNIPTPVPTAATKFKYEVMYQPDSVLRDKFPNLVYSRAHKFGGHFAGMQTPKELTEDIFDATKEFLRYHRDSKKTEL